MHQYRMYSRSAASAATWHADQGALLGAVVAAVQVAALRADAGQQVAHEHLQLLRKLQGALHTITLRTVSVWGSWVSQVPSVGLGGKTADDPDVGQQAAQKHLQLLRKLQGALHMIAPQGCQRGEDYGCLKSLLQGPGETAAEGASAGQLAAQQRLEAICRHRGSCKAAAAAEESPQAWVRKMHDCRCRCMGSQGGAMQAGLAPLLTKPLISLA